MWGGEVTGIVSAPCSHSLNKYLLCTSSESGIALSFEDKMVKNKGYILREFVHSGEAGQTIR